MDDSKIRTFMQLAGQEYPARLDLRDEATRKLGAQLLLSETLEYVIKGLGVIPEFDGIKITAPDQLHYHTSGTAPDSIEMLDGLSDVAYTMYWNSVAFALPLEEAFRRVCENNLQKFVRLSNWKQGPGVVEKSQWDLGLAIKWPAEVASVEVLKIDSALFAVGKDARGKVRKPSSYSSVELTDLIDAA